MFTGMTVAMINELKGLNMKDREKLAGILMSEEGNFIDSLFSCVSEDEKIRSQEIRKQAEELKKYPAAVWAAQTLNKLDKLIYSLAQIREEAVNAQTKPGSYMLLEALNGITDRMVNTMIDNDNVEVMHILADESK